ncbi:hypothetical protein Tco_0021946, partial [Tanacetum coccineum]
YGSWARILDKIMNDKDCSLVFGVFELMKWASEDPSYVTGGELEYPQELFSAGASCTQRKVSMVSFGRISPNSFLYSIPLVVVIIVTVVIIMVILIVVVVAIVGVVIVVAIFGVVVVDGWAYAFHQDKASLVRVPVANFPLFATGISLGLVFLLGLSAFAMAATCISRAVAMLLAISCWMAAKVMVGVLDVDILLGGILST